MGIISLWWINAIDNNNNHLSIESARIADENCGKCWNQSIQYYNLVNWMWGKGQLLNWKNVFISYYAKKKKIAKRAKRIKKNNNVNDNNKNGNINRNIERNRN